MRMPSWFGRVAALVCLAGWAAVVASPATAAKSHDGDGGNQGGTVKVFAPGSTVDGKSLAAWGAAWWTWDYGLPFSTNPILDPTGAFNQLNQSGPVFFLAGNAGGTSDRTVTIPSGKKIFFALLNIFNDYPCPDPSFQPAPGQSLEDFLTAGCHAIYDPVVGSIALTLTVDGEAQDNLIAHRETSRMVNFTGDPSMVAFDPCVTGTLQQGVADGWWIMLAPLPVGPHTIHFTGAIPPYGFALDVTYHVTVSDHGNGAQASPAAMTPALPTSWGRLKTIYR